MQSKDQAGGIIKSNARPGSKGVSNRANRTLKQAETFLGQVRNPMARAASTLEADRKPSEARMFNNLHPGNRNMKITNQVAQGVLYKLQGSSSVEDVRRVPQKQGPKNVAGSASVNNFMIHPNSNNQTQNFNSLHGTLNVHKHPKTKQKFLKMMPLNSLNG